MKEKLTLLATAVGSLPHNEPNSALDLLFEKFPNFPLWPQLANVNPKEDMIAQLMQNIPGVVFQNNRWYINQDSEEFFEQLEEFFTDYESIVNDKNFELLDKYGITGEYTSTFPLFIERIKESKPVALKGQITGPFTFATSLVDMDKKCAYYDETLKDILVKALTLKALWQVVKFKEASPNSIPVIFLDEPSISQYGTSAFITISKEAIIDCINQIATVLKENGAMVGVHCCGKTDWSIITGSNLDVLNFDGYYFAQSLSLYSKELEEFLQKGGMIAWGMIPTLDKDALEATNLEALEVKFEEAKDYLIKKGISEDLIIKSSFITPACGAGSLSFELTLKAMTLTSSLAQKLKDKYAI